MRRAEQDSEAMKEVSSMENVACELQGGKSLEHRFSNVNMYQIPLEGERKLRLLGLPQSLGVSGPGKGPEELHFGCCQSYQTGKHTERQGRVPAPVGLP